MQDVPDGWVPLGRSSPFLDLVGPLWVLPQGPVFGLRVAERHLNGRGRMHGGMLGPVADVLLGYTLTYAADRPLLLTTAHLAVDLQDGVDRGEWLEGRALPGRTGRSLAFGYAEFTVAGRVVAAARAVFGVRPADPEKPFPPRPW